MGVCESIKQKIKESRENAEKQNRINSNIEIYEKIGMSFGRPFLGKGLYLPLIIWNFSIIGVLT